jgi:hypothetical protein
MVDRGGDRVTTRAKYDLPGIYRGDDWDVLIGFYGQGGGLIGTALEGGGASIASGTNTVTLPSGVMIRNGSNAPRGFVDADIGSQFTLLNGEGLADGAVITDVDPTGRSCSLSVSATATRDGDCVCVVRAIDLSGFDVSGQVRSSSDATDYLFDLPILADRFAAGVLEIFMPSRQRATIASLPLTGAHPVITDTVAAVGPYDIQFVDQASGYTTTPLRGVVSFVKDITHQ